MKYFTPLKRATKPIRLATFDTEGNGSPDGFVCAAVISDRGRHFFTDRKSTLDYLLSPELRGYWIFAHNLEYDLGVLTCGDLRQFRCLFTSRNIISATVEDKYRHKWYFYDSTNVFPSTSIKQLGESLGLPKIELDPVLEACFRQGISFRELSEAGQAKARAYCYRDAAILYDALVDLQEELNTLGGNLKPTAAGCAMDLYRRRFMRSAWPIVDENLNRLARTAYYGARTEPYRLGYIAGVNGFDVSSLYPSVMATEQFPHPGTFHLDLNPNDTMHLDRHDGVCAATVLIPDCDPPPLPQRWDHKLYFPLGHLRGVWPNNELRYAREQGAIIQEIDWILWAGGSFNPFEEFVETLYNLRVLHASDNPVKEHFLKILLNSSYGRYGINPDVGLSELIPILDNDQWDDLRGSELVWIQGFPYALRMIENQKPPPYANAMIAAYIAAGARVKMHGLIGENYEGLCYTDTDSLWTSENLGSRRGLGELRQTHKNMDLWVVAPKEYAVFSGENLIEAHAKGVPEAYRLDYLKDGQVSFDQPTKIREAIRRHENPSVWLQTLKRRQFSWPKRCPLGTSLVQQEYWPTRPWTLAELRFHQGTESGKHYFQGWYHAQPDQPGPVEFEF